MTDNFDQFDQSPDFEEAEEVANKKGGLTANLAEAWRTRPVFKLIVLMIGVGALVAGVISLTSSKPPEQITRVAEAPGLNEPPGGKASPAFIEAQAQANAQRIQEAASRGETVLPTPLPSGISVDQHKEGDPLVEFRAEMQRQKEEQQKQIQALQQQTQQQQQVSLQQDQQLQERMSQALQNQMGQMAELWRPKPMEVVAGVDGDFGLTAAKKVTTEEATAAHAAAVAVNANGATQEKVKPLVPAGTVNYAQLLTEANSDVPGPILAQILSGPLSGARAIGEFTETNELLALHFKLAVLKGKEYQIDALALDPDTTLGGIATEVDHRYFTRVLLPAAASFVSAFGQTMSVRPTDTTITGTGTVVTSQTQSSLKDGLYAGIGSAGTSISGFFDQQAAQTKVLVRVAVGTPMGLFFTSSVCKGDYPCTAEAAPGKVSAAPAQQVSLQQGNAAPPVAAAPDVASGAAASAGLSRAAAAR